MPKSTKNSINRVESQISPLLSTGPPSKPSLSLHKGWIHLLKKSCQDNQLNDKHYFHRSVSSQEQYYLPEIRSALYQMLKDSNDIFLAAKAAKHVTPLTFGCFSLTLWTAPDLMTLLKNASSFSILLSAPIRLRFHTTPLGDAELWIVNNEPLDKETHVTYAGLTLYISTLVTMIQCIYGSHPIQVEIKLIDYFYEDKFKEKFEAITNSKISIGSPIRKICIPKKYLHTSLEHSDPEIYFSSLTLLRKKAAELERNDIVLQVYNALNQMPSLAHLTGKNLASKMLMNIRTLNRRLSSVNTSYKGVIDKYKLEKALNLLENPNVNMTEIAFQLGFSDLSTFSRAFKRWTGTSPTKLDKISRINIDV